MHFPMGLHWCVIKQTRVWHWPKSLWHIAELQPNITLLSEGMFLARGPFRSQLFKDPPRLWELWYQHQQCLALIFIFANRLGCFTSSWKEWEHVVSHAGTLLFLIAYTRRQMPSVLLVTCSEPLTLNMGYPVSHIKAPDSSEEILFRILKCSSLLIWTAQESQLFPQKHLIPLLSMGQFRKVSV